MSFENQLIGHLYFKFLWQVLCLFLCVIELACIFRSIHLSRKSIASFLEMHLKCIIFTGRSAIIENDWKKIELGPPRLFSHPLLCDLPSPPKCEFIVPSSRIFHLHHWVLPIKVGDNWKLYPHPTLLQVVSSPKALLIPVFYDKRSPILTRTLIFSNIKKFPSQKKKHNKITFKHLLFLK